MRDLPTGTVTFLFTDIEGSTRLLGELGDRYADKLADHRRALREIFATHDGAEVDTQGDAFFVAFGRANDAVAAAADAQRALAEGPIKVRIGVHTGEPLVTDEGYAGMDVHRAARIAASGHGGQVLVSQTARDLVEDSLPDNLALRGLGAHRLKDLGRPEQIFQLVGEGLQRDFPPLSTLDNRPTNLPLQPTRLIGRERELAEVEKLLRRPDVRLVTVTGPGGAGKTRLTLQTAADLLDDFGDGVFLVGLAGVAEASLVVPAIAGALGVREVGGIMLEDALDAFVHDRELLLVLDNLEHVLDAAPQILELVLKAPALKAILSSRAPLRVSGEWEYPIPDLPDQDAVALFSERAQATKPDFRLNGNREVVAEICRRLDGLPLAIELAAARSKVLTPSALLERLERRLPMLTAGTRDVPDRQRTLRDTIGWSYELLDDAEQRLFERLAVFVGGFSLEAAEHVCDADLDTLASLVEKSLVRQTDERFRMLETIREFALERLEESGMIDEARRAHVDFFLEFARPWEEEVGQGRPEPAWLDRFDSEHDNLRAALGYVRELDDPRRELGLVAALADFWEVRGQLSEGLARVRDALTRDPEAPPELLGPILRRGTLLAVKVGDTEMAWWMVAGVNRLHESTGDEHWLALALNLSGIAAELEGRYTDARDFLERAKEIRKRLGDEAGVCSTLHNLGLVAMDMGDYPRARMELRSALAIEQKNGWESAIANTVCDLGFAELGDGRHEAARARFGEALTAAVRMGWKENVAYFLVGLGRVELEGDNLERAARFLGQVDRLEEEIQFRFGSYAAREQARLERGLASRLAPERFEALREEGRSLSFDDAVTEARRALD